MAEGPVDHVKMQRILEIHLKQANANEISWRWFKSEEANYSWVRNLRRGTLRKSWPLLPQSLIRNSSRTMPLAGLEAAPDPRAVCGSAQRKRVNGIEMPE